MALSSVQKKTARQESLRMESNLPAKLTARRICKNITLEKVKINYNCSILKFIPKSEVSSEAVNVYFFFVLLDNLALRWLVVLYASV
jgi:hypothetical protein